MSKQVFNIDFFELMFLCEACIPPTPIARAHFWDKMIDEYYNQLSPNQREKVFEWINRNSHYEEQLKNGNERVKLFNARYDPNNQYRISYQFGEEKGEVDAFLHNGEYKTERNTIIIPDYIVKIEKL